MIGPAVQPADITQLKSAALDFHLAVYPKVNYRLIFRLTESYGAGLA